MPTQGRHFAILKTKLVQAVFYGRLSEPTDARPKLENLVASMHMRTESLPSPATEDAQGAIINVG